LDTSTSVVPPSPSEQVRAAFARWACSLSPHPVEEIQETILIRQGHYCGRRLSASGFSAIWFIDESQIKLIHADGQSLGTYSMNDFLNSPNLQTLSKSAA
jgi:hypothetical protein